MVPDNGAKYPLNTDELRCNMRKSLAVFGFTMMTGTAAVGLAATTTTTFAVTATVAASCSLGTVPTLGFGTYDPTSGTNADSTTSIAVTCTLLTPYNIGLSAGTTSGSSISQRKLQGVTPANTLNYNLYTNAGRTVVWGNTVGTDSVAGVGTGLTQNHTVYGRINSGTAASIDTYSDTITVTVTY